MNFACCAAADIMWGSSMPEIKLKNENPPEIFCLNFVN